jgi:hypothetical protein
MGAFNQAHDPHDERQDDPELGRLGMAEVFAELCCWPDVAQRLRDGDEVPASWAREDELDVLLAMDGLRIVVADGDGYVERRTR